MNLSKHLQLLLLPLLLVLSMAAPSIALANQGQDIVNAAASQVGLPYCFDGGNTSGPTHGSGGSGCGGTTVGFDCSGLALYAVYQATGIVLPHGSGMESVTGGTVISSQSDLQPGDLVFFGGGSLANFEHVGIYAGNGMMWDANDYNVPVQEHSLAWEENAQAFDGGVRYGHGLTTSGNAGTLWFVKTKNTGSGRVEIHSATPGTSYQGGQHSATWFSSAEANNGWFQMVGTNLWFIKTKNTGSGRVEVHSATVASGYQSGVHYASLFSSGEADNGWFQMDDWNRDGVQDLVFIKTKNTGSGRVEFFVADGTSGYSRLLVATATAFSPGDASNGWFQEQGRDLVFIKTRNTGSGRVEYFRASASSNFGQITVATPTVFYPYDQSNGWFSSEDVNGDGRADELFIKTHNTGSGHVELFDSDAMSGYQQLTQAVVTWFSPADADNGWFQVESKQ